MNGTDQWNLLLQGTFAVQLHSLLCLATIFLLLHQVLPHNLVDLCITIITITHDINWQRTDYQMLQPHNGCYLVHHYQQYCVNVDTHPTE